MIKRQMAMAVLAAIGLGGLADAAAVPSFRSVLDRFELRGGLSPSDYRALRVDADRLFEDEKWEQAAAAFRRLADAYQADGEVYAKLGVALYQLHDYAAAANAFERAHDLGLPREGAENAADAAKAYAKLGRADEAVRWLTIAIELKQRDPDSLLAGPEFDPIRQTPAFQALVATRQARPAVTRDEQIAADIDYFMSKYRSYEAGKLPAGDWARFEAAAESFKRRVPQLSDAQVVGEFHKLIVMAGLGHNGLGSIYIGQGVNGTKLKALPVDFYLFPEGLYIIGTTDKRDDLVGARVLNIGGVPVEEALSRAQAIVDHEGNSDMTFAWQAPREFAQPELLQTIGLMPDKDRALLTIVDRTGKRRDIALRPTPFRRTGKLYAPQLDGNPIGPPLYLSRVDDSFWFTDVAPHTVYFQYNGIDWKNERPGSSETIESIAEELRKHLEQTNADRLIVDLRHNNGGDTYSYVDLLRVLIAFDVEPGHRLYLITGRDTYSAAENFSVDVSRLTHATLVGEPGSKPRATGDPVWITLPHTRLRAYVASGIWSLYSPFDRRRWLPVQMPVVLTAKDYFSSKDPALAAILEDSGRSTAR